MVAPQSRKPQHPGEILSERFLAPRGISHYDLAKTLHIAEATISNFVGGRSDLTVGLAVRLSRAFDLSTQEWIALQRMFDHSHRQSA
ncbi:HigA family addiction module antitoxin [Corynebacterium crudilactis]|uniref:Addiction module antidote protein, HigA family n=1 Tax=Corynebacterium crudilactis TaxID=1652495 RepID=A0A172QTJ1_9CORY|nr:HigA family addiction module antitoxin [Corynebacterium crudilactis]ANE04027.1 addiction module antidote protein, HigA family [Corynebacterium crudilactis]